MPYAADTPLDDRSVGRVVYAGGFSLAFLAGFVNGAMLDLLDVPVSHMSGAISRLGVELARGERAADATSISLVIAFFLFGCIASGVILGNQRLRPGKPYGIVLIIEGLALIGAAILLRHGNRWSLPLAAMACGLQNAMASSYYGLIIRTTHVTGVVTDIGFMLGSWMRDGSLRAWKLLLLVLIVVGFAAGGYSAVRLSSRGDVRGMLGAAIACCVSGIVYYVWHDLAASRRGTRAMKRPS